MTTIYYSSFTRGFYRDDIHADLPTDAVEISEDTHVRLMAAQEAGREIVPGPDGRPVAVDPPAPDPSAARRVEILARLGEIDAASTRPLRAIVTGSATDDDRTRLQALDTEAAALRTELAASPGPTT